MPEAPARAHPMSRTIHGDDDQVVPYEVGGRASAALVAGADLITYEGAPHGITDTHKVRLGADLLAFVNSLVRAPELAGAATGKEGPA